MTNARIPFPRLSVDTSIEVLRMALVLGCAAALALAPTLAGISFQV